MRRLAHTSSKRRCPFGALRSQTSTDLSRVSSRSDIWHSTNGGHMEVQRRPPRSTSADPITRALRELTAEMFGERDLIIASNRGPIEFELDERSELHAQRGSGGVVTAL